MVELLLKHGANPNTVFMGESIWRHALRGALSTTLPNILRHPVADIHFINIDDVPSRYISTVRPDPVNNTYFISPRQMPSDLWADVFKLCLKHGAQPQDALKLLSGNDDYAEVLDSAKQLIKKNKGVDSNKSNVRKVVQTRTRRFWEQFLAL